MSVKPAMTPERWAELFGSPGPDTVWGHAMDGGEHAAAAWALHGQWRWQGDEPPAHAFTWDMVHALREIADEAEAEGATRDLYILGDTLTPRSVLVRRIADLIASLLPPESA